jgi:hypothetical protein
MSVDGFAMACPSCYLKVKKLGDNIGAEVGDILKWIDGKLTENKYTNSIYVNGKKLTVGVFRESSENSPETLKTFLEVLTLTGGGKVAGKIGEKATTGSIELGGKLKDGAKKVFTKADDINVKPNSNVDLNKINNKEFHSKMGDTLKTDIAFTESILKDKSKFEFIGEFDLHNPGVLDNKYARTFSGYKYKSYTLKEDTILYRVGSKDKGFGDYLSFNKPNSEIQSRVDKAIRYEWEDGSKSIIDNVYEIIVPKGTRVHVGITSNQRDFYLGGTHQIVIPALKEVPGVSIVASNKINKR